MKVTAECILGAKQVKNPTSTDLHVKDALLPGHERKLLTAD